MALRFDKPKLVPFTEPLGREFRDMESLTNERSLTQQRLRKHLRLLEQGQFFTPAWGKVLFEGKWFRANGNHTSHILTAAAQRALSQLDERSEGIVKEMLGIAPEDLPPVPEGLHVSLEIGYADSPDDLLAAFMRYDSKDSVRTAKDVRDVFIGEHHDLRGLSKDNVGKALAGVIRCIKGGVEGCDVDPKLLAATTRVSNGAALRVPQVRAVVKWIVETVPERKLYEKSAGGVVFAEVYFLYGASEAERLVDAFMEAKQDAKTAAHSFVNGLFTTYGSATSESLIARGRKAFRELLKKRRAG